MAENPNSPDPPAARPQPDAPRPVSLKRASDQWIRDADATIEAMEKESFGQSLEMMSDFESNYFRQVSNNSYCPALPESTFFISHSRRFAKLAEAFRDGDRAALRMIAMKQFAADLTRWKKLHDGGQKVVGGGAVSISGPAESYIWPLSWRINSILLLLAQHPEPSDLGVVARYAETLGEEGNAALAGFLAARAFESVDPSGGGEIGRGADAYRAWASKPDMAQTLAGEALELPSFRSPVRPSDLVSSVGLRMRNPPPLPAIELRVPQSYMLLIRLDASQGLYDDASRGKHEINRRAVEWARQLAPRPAHGPPYALFAGAAIIFFLSIFIGKWLKVGLR